MKLSDIVAKTSGKFFTVTFIKKDGTIRALNGRLGVTKHLKGGQCTLDRDRFLIVYDVQSKGYRSVNVDTILSVNVDGLTVERNPNVMA